MKSIKQFAPRQMMLRKPFLWVALAALLLVGGGAIWYFTTGRSLGSLSAAAGGSSSAAEPGYQTTVARRGDLRISATGTGTLYSGQTVDLSFSTSGSVAALNVKVGDDVKAGQELAKLGNIEDLQANVASAQLALLQAQQSLEELQSNADVSVAQAYQDWLDAQDAYNTAVDAEMRSSGARCSSDVMKKYTAALDRATTKLNNINARDYGSDAYVDAKNDYDTAKANYDYCASYTALEKTSTQSNVEVAKNTMDQAEKKYNTLKGASGIDPTELAVAEATVTKAETQLANAKDILTGATLTSPIDGKVITIAANQGTYVDLTKTGAYITIANMYKPELDTSLDETELTKIQVGDSAEVTFDALPDQVFTGKITQVSPQLTTTGNYRVAKCIVTLDDSAADAVSKLPLGLSVTVNVIEDEAKGAVLVASQAVRDLGDDEYAVFVVGNDGKLTLKSVQVGLNDGALAEIKSGLNPGDVVSTGLVPSSSK
jgi:RND family efflux transporter MFP subunit